MGRERNTCQGKTALASVCPEILHPKDFPGQKRSGTVLHGADVPFAHDSSKFNPVNEADDLGAPITMKFKVWLWVISTPLLLLPVRGVADAPWWSPSTESKKGNAGVAQVGGSVDESDQNGSVRVDVVVDMTDAGKRIARPTPERPAYYLPLPMGYKEFGYEAYFKRPPPTAIEIQQMLSYALAQQGYELMSKQNHPSIVLSFFWGYMDPEDVEMQSFDSFQGGRVPPIGQQADGTMGATMISLGSMPANQGMMLALISGDGSIEDTNPSDPRMREALDMAKRPRYFVLISAFGFDSWLKSLQEKKNGRPVVDKPILLWRAHISTELWGHYFDQVAQTLITTAAPWFGRETKGPQLATIPLIPTGRVIVGAPTVKEYPSIPQKSLP